MRAVKPLDADHNVKRMPKVSKRLCRDKIAVFIKSRSGTMLAAGTTRPISPRISPEKSGSGRWATIAETKIRKGNKASTK